MPIPVRGGPSLKRQATCPSMRWSRAELLLVLHLYERIPFGHQHSRRPEVIALADRLGRTPGSVAMKLNNLTSLDPEEIARGVRGLPGASQLDGEVWKEFRAHPEVVEEAEALWTDGAASEPTHLHRAVDEPDWEGPTEGVSIRANRLAQRYFRRVVLANFEGRCALTGVAIPELLIASHIVSWRDAPEHRVNAANGLCLNRLHDGAFDKALVTFDEELRLVIGRRLRAALADDGLSASFLRTEGVQLRPPQRRAIDPALLTRHRMAFVAANAA